MLSSHRNALITSAATGAMAAMLVAFGGQWAYAQDGGRGAVNAGARQAASVAPVSFADIVERVAPAVVSIDVESKAPAGRTAFFGQRGAAPDGDSDDDDDAPSGRGLPPGFDFRQLIPQQPDGSPLPPVRGTGSGFFISSDGYIVTNNHVVEDAEKVTVRIKDDDEPMTAKVIGRDPATDLAVIKVEGRNFPFVSFEERAKPRVGDWVVAVGNPFNLGGTVTAGIVSALGRGNVSGSNYVDYIQIDAPINRGNSGGPTFDLQGRVVGVNSAIFSPSGGSVGIGFDIPSDVAASVTRQLISDGKVVRGYIGATVQNLTPEIAESVGLAGRKGALVSELTPDGPSEKAGLKPGDVVLKVNGHDVTSSTDLTRQVALARGGDVIKLDIRRDGQPQQIAVRSGIRPDETVLARANFPGGGQPVIPRPQGSPLLGMQLTPGADGGLEVQSVSRASDAAEKGLRKGDVILQAGGRKTDTAAALTGVVAEARKDGRKSVLLLVIRGGQRVFVPVKVDEPAPAAQG